MDSFDLSTDTYDPAVLERERRISPSPGNGTRPTPKPEVPKSKKEKTAPPRKATKPKMPKQRQPNFFTDGRFAIFMGIVFIIAAVYLLIVSISYFSHGADDQSAIRNSTVAELSDAPHRVSNAGGPVGAFVADLLLSRWLGLGSFVLIFYIGALGISLIKVHHFKFWALTFKCLISAITASVLLGFVTYGFTSSSYWGGAHGYWINHLLMDSTGIWGALGVNIILVSTVILIFLTQIQKAWAVSHRRWVKHRERLAAERKAAEERRRKAAERLEAEPIPATSAEAEEEEEEEPSTHVASVEFVGEEMPVAEKEVKPAVNAPTAKRTVLAAAVAPEPTPVSVTPESVLIPERKLTDMPVSDIPVTVMDSVTDADVPEMADSVDLKPVRSAESDADLIIRKNEIEVAPVTEQAPYDPTAELSRYRFPTLDLLHQREVKSSSIDLDEQQENKERITRTLNSYGIEIARIEATVGPTITLYEIVPAEGVRIQKIKSLEDDLALNLAALGIRIIAPMPGKGTIGMEVPNKEAQIVPIRNILSSKKFQESDADLPMAMGSTISNDVYLADLCKMPHLLVAGATGMGKSVGLNTIIASLLYKKHPAELKFVLIDPKMVEFSLYAKLERHFLAKLPDEEDAVITDTNKVVPTLNSLCQEMENRYILLKNAGVRNIKDYNQRFVEHRLNPEKGHRYLPYLVVIVDEFADLIMTAGKEVEKPIARIAQKARAVGIHMILATQRPSTNVITGIIKANFPGRVAFRVTQMVDSRTILDRPGANQLIGRGDMLFSRDGKIDRVQCAFIDTDEVEAICDCIAEQIGYETPYLLPDYIPTAEEGGGGGSFGAVTDRDSLFEEAGRAIIESGIGSTSYLQRKFNIGYPRAGKIMDQLEKAGVVGAAMGGKPRAVLMDLQQFESSIQM